MVYIQKSPTLGYTTHALNLLTRTHFSMWENPLFFLLKILNILTHVHGKRGEPLRWMCKVNLFIYLIMSIKFKNKNK